MPAWCLILLATASISGAEPAEQITATVYLDQPRQVMRGFGASDAWNMGRVGRYWRPEQKAALARLLFSTGYDESTGRPDGVGLSIWRFNVGAGSAEQGEASGISDATQRAECFLNADGTYDWTKQAGQRWFLEQAHAYEVSTLIAFTNSAPVYFTRNGLARGSGGTKSNLRADRADAFGEFWATVASHFADAGMPFTFVSPFNEPQWAWESDKQEGNPATNAEIADVVRAIDRAFQAKAISAKQYLVEAGDYEYLYALRRPEAQSNQIEALFSPRSPHFVGDLPTVAPIIGGHAYWTYYDNQQTAETREAVRRSAAAAGLTFEQTEYCLLGAGKITQDQPETSWEIALFMAKVMHADLALADAASWSFWTTMARTGPRQLDRYCLISMVDNDVEDWSAGGDFTPEQTLWVLGQYSRFVRPGYFRLATTGDGLDSPVLTTAYLAPDGATLVTVHVNLSAEPKSLRVAPTGKQLTGEPVSRLAYFTDENHDLALLVASGDTRTDEFLLPAKSVTTIVQAFSSTAAR